MQFTKSEIAEFSYIKDVDGYIFISLGVKVAEGEIVCLTYVPDNHGSKSSLTGERYAKCIFETDVDSVQLLDVSQTVKDKMRSMIVCNPHTQEQFLVLGYSKIAYVFSAQESLSTIMTHQKYLYARPSVQSALTACDEAGIPREIVGIYGGIQALLTNPPKLYDVDLVFNGLKYYPNTITLMSQQGYFVNSELDYADTHEYKAKVTPRRWENSFMRIDDETGCDLRICRRSTDRHSYLKMIARPELADYMSIEIDKAIVINADESLSMCPAYQIQTNNGHTYWVSSLYYCFVGIAKVGDKVKVKGKQLSKDEIAIFSPNCAEEYIEPIDCDPLGIIEANFATARV